MNSPVTTMLRNAAPIQSERYATGSLAGDGTQVGWHKAAVHATTPENATGAAR